MKNESCLSHEHNNDRDNKQKLIYIMLLCVLNQLSKYQLFIFIKMWWQLTKIIVLVIPFNEINTNVSYSKRCLTNKLNCPQAKKASRAIMGVLKNEEKCLRNTGQF